MDYYLLIEEWNYPTESGREVLTDTYDATEEGKADALKVAADKCENELYNYEDATGIDALVPAHYENGDVRRGNTGIMKGEGYIITPKNGLDEWYYAVRLIRVKPMYD